MNQLSPAIRELIHWKCAIQYLQSMGEKGLELEHACGKSAIEVLVTMNKDLVNSVIDLSTEFLKREEKL